MIKSVNKSFFFYQDSRLVTVKQGKHHRAIFRSAEMPLAEQQTGEMSGNALLATDDKGSVLQVQSESDEAAHSYSAYGHAPALLPRRHSLGFNGERIEPQTLGYLLGNGYRLYSPELMRFLAPDNLSPFDEGGMNPFAYCHGDPLNYTDPTGHVTIQGITSVSRRKIEIFSTMPKKQWLNNQEIFNQSGNTANLSLPPKTATYTLTRTHLHSIKQRNGTHLFLVGDDYGKFASNLSEIKSLQAAPKLFENIDQRRLNIQINILERQNSFMLKAGERRHEQLHDLNDHSVQIRKDYKPIRPQL